jgi:hypothetical protein
MNTPRPIRYPRPLTSRRSPRHDPPRARWRRAYAWIVTSFAALILLAAGAALTTPSLDQALDIALRTARSA